MGKPKNDEELKALSKMLQDAVKELLESRSSFLKLEANSDPIQKQLREYEGKMHIIAMDKLNEPTYVSAINFYLTDADREEKNAIGAIVMYLNMARSEEILKGFGFKKIDEDDHEKMLGFCNELCEEIGDAFIKKTASKGFPNLIKNDPESYRSEFPLGVDFSFEQLFKYEINFVIKEKDEDVKMLIFDLTMGALK